jgi:rhamnogalacturonyl hydrolase YesR
MKAVGAALIAAAILYVVDSRYNDGRYTQVLQQAVTSLLPG